MFIVSLYDVASDTAEWAWDFPTREKAEEFITLFNSQCAQLLPGDDLSGHYSLRVSEAFDEPVSSFEEMFAIWQSTAQPAWLVASTKESDSSPLDADSPSAAEVLVLPEGSMEEIFDDLVLQLSGD